MRNALRLGAALIIFASCAPVDPTTVRIDTGLIKGTMDDGVRVFKGIPYAAPPMGDLRWRPPGPAASWDGVREATDWGFSCVHEPYPPDSLWNGPE